MSWTYMLVDWYWYNQDSPDPHTAIKPEPHIDMPALMAYAKAKGVKLILWVNSKNIRSIGMDKLFATYAAWGAAGVKIDFFSRLGSQATQRWQEELLAGAAKHKLVVDFHGTYTPTGLERTWPNFITMEGVLGEVRQTGTAIHAVAHDGASLLADCSALRCHSGRHQRAKMVEANAITQVVGTRTAARPIVLMDSPDLCLYDSPRTIMDSPGSNSIAACQRPGMKRECSPPK
jgi:alpha-glucosidase